MIMIVELIVGMIVKMILILIAELTVELIVELIMRVREFFLRRKKLRFFAPPSLAPLAPP